MRSTCPLYSTWCTCSSGQPGPVTTTAAASWPRARAWWAERLPYPEARSPLFASLPSCACSPGQRTDEELDLIFEELLHIKAVAHLSNSVSLPASTLPPGPPLPANPCGPYSWASRCFPPLRPLAWKCPSNFWLPTSLSKNPSAPPGLFPSLALSPAESRAPELALSLPPGACVLEPNLPANLALLTPDSPH